MAKAVTARQRITEPGLRSWDEVDQALREIGLIDLDVEAMEAEFNRQVADLKSALEERAKPLLERKDYLGRLIKEFTEDRRAELKGKTKELNFGKLGFRQTTQIVLRNVKAILSALKARGMDDCIIVKEQVSKEALRGYDDQVLASLGVQRKVEDVFWYEPDRERLRQP